MKNKSLTKKEWVKLIEGTQHGRKEAFEELCRLKTPNIMFLCKSALNNWEDAEDAAQEVMIKMQKDINNLKNPEAFPSWLDRLCVNVCLTMRRKRMKEQYEALSENLESDYQDFSPEAFPADIIETSESRRMVMEAIESLPYTFRMAIILHYYEGLKAVEVAEVMNVTVAMAKHYIQRGRSALKGKIHLESYRGKDIAMSIALPAVIDKTDMVTSIERSAHVLKAAGIPLTAPSSKSPLAASITLLAIIGGFVIGGVIAATVIMGAGSEFDPLHLFDGENGTVNSVSSPQNENPSHLILSPASLIADSITEQAPQLSQNDSSVGEEEGISSSSAPNTEKAGAALMGLISLNNPYGSGGTVESSIAGITVELVNAKSPYNVVKTTKTMGGKHSGWYLFENLKPGSYLVRPRLPAYFQPLPQGDNLLKNGYICCKAQTVFTVKEGRTLTVSLPVYQTGSISGTMLAGQGELNNQLAGIIVKLYDKQSTLLMETVTQPDGSYLLKYPPILAADTYYLRFYVPGEMGMSLETGALSVSYGPGENKTVAPNTVVDNMPPSLQVVAYNNPASPAYSRASAFKIHTFDTGNVTIDWTLEDATEAVARGSGTEPGNALDGLAAGIYVLHVAVTDRVGNVSTFQTIVCLG